MARLNWEARYIGQEYSDKALDMALDRESNVYITGTSSYDYATVKYDSEGIEIWAARYNDDDDRFDTAHAIAVDEEGNVYVTGESGVLVDGLLYYDFATIKYDSHGIEQWVRIYDGPAHKSDKAYGIMVDGEGSVYVTGYSTGIETSWDWTTIKYDSEGNEIWLRRYDADGRGDVGRSLAMDVEGNIYIVGDSQRIWMDWNLTTMKYDAEGNELWVREFDGPEHGYDVATDFALDREGNVCVTGIIDWDSRPDYVTIKYDSEGNELWVRFYDGPGDIYGSTDRAAANEVDAEGNVYVTGTSTGTDTSQDYVTIKYDPQGNELWLRRYDGQLCEYDYASAIALDRQGNVYVTGESEGVMDSYYDYTTIKYDPDGNELWVERKDGPGNSGDEPEAIAVDLAGRVYVTGSMYEMESGWDYSTLQYIQKPPASSTPGQR
jgi:streptogramin lyase